MSNKTILIVEDSETMREMLKATISSFGDIIEAENGKTGLELALKHLPSLILLDVVLPDIDGFKVCKGLKKDERTKHIPVIVMTGMEGAKPEIQGLNLGAADFVRKPFETAVVRARVNTQLDLVTAREELLHMASIDPLTNCFNRRHFMNAADMELSRRKRHSHSVVVAMLDVDKFKMINDTYGHDVGDLVLQEIVESCKDTVRYEDTVGRMGGEEFAILLPEAEANGAYTVLERVRENIAALEFEHRGHPFSVTVSIGLSEVDYSDIAIDSALKRADEALYEAKRSGRDQVLIN